MHHCHRQPQALTPFAHASILHAALVKMAPSAGGADEIIPIGQLDPSAQALVPQLKAGAFQGWHYPHHPGWCIYFKVCTRDHACRWLDPTSIMALLVLLYLLQGGILLAAGSA